MVLAKRFQPPNEFSYLGHKGKTYRVIEQAEDFLEISRDDGTVVRVPHVNILRCYEALMAASEQVLPMQQIPAGQPGESVVAAILVAAGLAAVVNDRPIELSACTRIKESGDPTGSITLMFSLIRSRLGACFQSLSRIQRSLEPMLKHGSEA